MTKRYHDSLCNDIMDISIGKRENELTKIVFTIRGERRTLYLDRHDAIDLARAILTEYEGSAPYA